MFRDPYHRKRRPVVAALASAVLATAGLAGAGSTAAATPSGHGHAPTLGKAAATKGKVFGTAVSGGHLGEAPYAKTLDTEFTGLTPENEMKWETTEPAPGQFDFAPADAIVRHARAQHMKVRGHTLVWHSQLPTWVGDIQSGPELLATVKNHIAHVAGHYRGKIQYWDVVNEAFNEDGTRRSTVFQQRIGDGYVEKAFRAAHAADPKAKLCYNDYNIDGINAKSDAVYKLVKDFRKRGVPITCVGLQAHLVVGTLPGDIKANIQRFARLGVDVNITELDIRMPVPATTANLTQQAADYGYVVSACVAVPRCTSISTWGITDKYSWVPGVFPGEGAPLLFDDDYGKKRAYSTTLRALLAWRP